MVDIKPIQHLLKQSAGNFVSSARHLMLQNVIGGGYQQRTSPTSKIRYSQR